MKTKHNEKKLIAKLILTTCSLAMISPLFMGKQESSLKDETLLVSSLYRSISSVETDSKDENKAENKAESKEEKKEGELSQTEEDKKKEQDLITLCENKKKIEDLDREIEKLEKEKDKVSEIVSKLEDDNKNDKAKKDKKESIMSTEVLSQLLMQQIYLNRMLSSSIMGTSMQQQRVFEQPKWIIGSNSGSLPSNYASMALYNQLALKLNANQMWSPQFNQQGNLTNSLYGSTNPTNPYNHNYVFAADQSVYGNLL